MEVNENTQKVINVLRGYGKKTSKLIIAKTLFSVSIVFSELKRLTENDLIRAHQGFGPATYTLNKNKYNCRWSAHESNFDFWFCIHPEFASKTVDETPCRNDTTCARHRFLDEPDDEELEGL